MCVYRKILTQQLSGKSKLSLKHLRATCVWHRWFYQQPPAKQSFSDSCIYVSVIRQFKQMNLLSSVFQIPSTDGWFLIFLSRRRRTCTHVNGQLAIGCGLCVRLQLFNRRREATQTVCSVWLCRCEFFEVGLVCQGPNLHTDILCVL